jgi:hypothetical protein
MAIQLIFLYLKAIRRCGHGWARASQVLLEFHKVAISYPISYEPPVNLMTFATLRKERGSSRGIRKILRGRNVSWLTAHIAV